MANQAQAAGVIHDLGYRGYDGPRLGRAQIVRALTWHSFRSALGIGRGVKGKIVPVLAFIAMCLPALVNAFAVARGNQRLFGYDVYVPGLRAAVVTIFIAAQAPELVSRDLRSHVLPLYFCRPLRRSDYPLAKYLALTAALLILIEIPLLILYVGTIASAKGGAAIWARDQGADPRTRRRPDVGRAVRGDRPGAGVPHRSARVLDRDRRDLVRPHVRPVPAADPGRRRDSRPRLPGRGSPGSSVRSPSSTGCASGSAATPRQGWWPIQAATGRSTGSWRWSCSRPASGAWPRDTGR